MVWHCHRPTSQRHSTYPPKWTLVANTDPRTSTLVVPSTRQSTVGDRAFPVAAARAWNSLPPTVPSTSSLASFCLHLKTNVRCVISSPTLNAILGLSFCTVPLQQFLWQRLLNRVHPFIHLPVGSRPSAGQGQFAGQIPAFGQLCYATNQPTRWRQRCIIKQTRLYHFMQTTEIYQNWYSIYHRHGSTTFGMTFNSPTNLWAMFYKRVPYSQRYLVVRSVGLVWVSRVRVTPYCCE